MKPSEKRDRAIAAIDAFLKKLPELSAMTEDTGIFWSHLGWSALPARWEFVQPQSQAWSGSRAMTDLTRYAPALETFVAYQDDHSGGIVLGSLARLWQAGGDATLPAAVAAVLGVPPAEAEAMLQERL